MNLLENMKNVDIRTVDRKNLVDIKKIQMGAEVKKCDEETGQREKIAEFIKLTGNPYCFMVGKVVIKSTFTEGASINRRFNEMVMSK